MTDDRDDFDDEYDGDFDEEFGDDFDDDLDGDFGDDFTEFDDLSGLLDDHESALVQQDLVDLASFEAAFRAEGYRGVAVYCQDCAEEHYYPWDMLRGNLELLLETGETPVHEPAYEPDPHEYIPWEYARGYVDALRDVGVEERRDVDQCSRCGLQIPPELTQASFCPRCGNPLLSQRLVESLRNVGLSEDEIAAVFRQTGLPG